MGTNVNKTRVAPTIASHKSDDAEVSWTQSPLTPASTRNRSGKAIPQYITTPTEDEYSDCDDYHQYLRSEAQKRQGITKANAPPTPTTTPKKKKKGKAKISCEAIVTGLCFPCPQWQSCSSTRDCPNPRRVRGFRRLP
ncbi:uncharacterized protein H6S33_010850 [Morchella sextelata]|uniref:uncharacterized protein n=1 Tax=Morchella sextelata TaxID=1174677 RepID=UPI001D0451BA|nr:uncharacterized protein H6S33_010850 [Morchella sextelata]KAH0611585.1 hypothetical protein H6S33_010850 [Morchella sextelata]